MSKLLKDIYSEAFYRNFTNILGQVLPNFDPQKFIKLIFIPEFETYELKERMAHTAKVLHFFLPENFEKAAVLLVEIVKKLEKNGIKEETIEFMFIPEYISMFGLKDYEASVNAIEFVTQFSSCEFAVRPFFVEYEPKMLAQMLLWSKHPQRKVRRLASEGSRPRLPWAMALPSFKKNPMPILPILENLKTDDCEVVRRSVANNLNDISKDNPDLVIDIIRKWKGVDQKTDALLKHGARTLLKAGNAEILAIYDLKSDNFSLSDFEITSTKVEIGGNLAFSFSFSSLSATNLIARLEYAIYFKKNKGSLSKKVFKISERNVLPKESLFIQKKHSFRIITTRIFYEGVHQLSVIINGKESNLLDFTLQSAKL